MDKRRHVWHDSAYPPPEIVTEDPSGRAAKSLKSSRLPKTLLAVLLVTLVAVILTVVGVVGAVVIAGVQAGIAEVSSDPLDVMLPLNEKEEEAVRGLATTIADRGKRGDLSAIAALGDDSPSLDRSELAADIASTFKGRSIKDWKIDTDNVQLLLDTKSKQRIIVFRMILTDTNDEQHTTSPLYAVERKGVWRLTGIKGRNVEEDLYD